jgi:hypothetical protein
MLPAFKVKKEISQPKERGDAAFTIKRWKKSICRQAFCKVAGVATTSGQ